MVKMDGWKQDYALRLTPLFSQNGGNRKYLRAQQRPQRALTQIDIFHAPPPGEEKPARPGDQQTGKIDRHAGKNALC